VGLLITFGLFFAVMCKWRNWPGGWCWGPRHIMQIHALLAVPLAFWLEGLRGKNSGDGDPVSDGEIVESQNETFDDRHLELGDESGDLDDSVAQQNKTLGICCRLSSVFLVLLVIGFAVQLYGSSQNFIEYYNTFYRQPKQPAALALYASPRFFGLPQYQIILHETDPAGNPTGKTLPIGANQLPAPINDSIYIPQNSQWSGYARLASQGTHDFFWLHLIDVVRE